MYSQFTDELHSTGQTESLKSYEITPDFYKLLQCLREIAGFLIFSTYFGPGLKHLRTTDNNI